MGLGLHGQSHGKVLMGVPLAHGMPMGIAGVLMGRPWAVLGLGLGLHGQSHTLKCMRGCFLCVFS